MLRLLVLALLIANGAFWSWREGWLDPLVGMPAHGDREPGRLAQQVRPERVRVVPPAPASARPANAVLGVSADAGTPLLCLEIGPYAPAQLAAARSALQTVVPPHQLADVRSETPGVWIVFMGPYGDAASREKKVEELQRRGVTFEDIRQVPELGDGLALSRHADRAGAERALAAVVAKGVRTARIAQYAPPLVTHTLRVADVSPDLQPRLRELTGAGLAGQSFTPCTP